MPGPFLGTDIPQGGTSQIRLGVNTMFKAFLRDESGASAAEYALILAIVGAGIAGAAFVLGTAIDEEMTDAAECIDGTTPASQC